MGATLSTPKYHKGNQKPFSFLASSWSILSSQSPCCHLPAFSLPDPSATAPPPHPDAPAHVFHAAAMVYRTGRVFVYILMTCESHC